MKEMNMIQTLQTNIASKILQHQDKHQQEFLDWKKDKQQINQKNFRFDVEKHIKLSRQEALNLKYIRRFQEFTWFIEKQNFSVGKTFGEESFNDSKEYKQQETWKAQ